MLIDILGYVGMAFVLCSFLMKEAIWIRIVNMIGAVLSLVYGILTITIPTAVLNGALLIINSIFLILYIIDKTKGKKNI